jgi:2-polyprenyl-3-methyl-5-hydroxy-6-metoxy-1,4-benzoquinol methylase
MAYPERLVEFLLPGRLLNFDAVEQGIDGVFRAVRDDGYAENFGLQWTHFSHTQYDDEVGYPRSRERLLQTSGWTTDSLLGAVVLEVGAGAGRFTRELLKMGARVVAVDLSRAIDVNIRENSALGDVVGVQASVYDLPIVQGRFARVLCLGVLQHTPNRRRTLESLWSFVAPGGSWW